MADKAILISTEMEEVVLALNNAHDVELSCLAPEQLRALLKQAFYARRIGDVDALLMAFDYLERPSRALLSLDLPDLEALSM